MDLKRVSCETVGQRTWLDAVIGASSGPLANLSSAQVNNMSDAATITLRHLKMAQVH